MPSFVTSYQTLGPGSGWRYNRAADLPYPLSHPRTRCYYLGRNAVYHGAKALGLGAGDEVVFPAWHSGTESAPLAHLGCKLRFYEVRRDLSIDLAEIESLITSATRAIYAIHFVGFQAPIAELRELADQHRVALIEDAALAFLGRLDDRPLGTWGDVSIFCLYKSLPTAAGGILAVNRDDVPLPVDGLPCSRYSELNLTIKRVLEHAEMHWGLPGYALRRLAQGFGRRGAAAAGLRVKSPDALLFEPELLDHRIGWWTERIIGWLDYDRIYRKRRANYQWLARELAGTGVRLLRPELPEGAVPLFLPVWAEDKFGTVERLQAEGLDAVPVWGIHHDHLPHGEFPQTEFLTRHAIEMPVHHTLAPRHLARIRDGLVRHCRWESFPHDDAPTDLAAVET
jgi:perosamine synthetase